MKFNNRFFFTVFTVAHSSPIIINLVPDVLHEDQNEFLKFIFKLNFQVFINSKPFSNMVV